MGGKPDAAFTRLRDDVPSDKSLVWQRAHLLSCGLQHQLPVSVQPSMLPWLLACLAVIALFAGAVVSWARQRKVERANLPKEWALAARPVFSADERRVYRQLREALPHHIVLSKLPLVRFCQPTDPQQVRYWYDLLGAINVAFAICSANGRVLAAIDLDTDRGGSRRAIQIKQAVLGACRVRYLRCPVDHLPSVPELQLLVPQGMSAARGPHAARPAQTSNDANNSHLSAPRCGRIPASSKTRFLRQTAVWTQHKLASSVHCAEWMILAKARLMASAPGNDLCATESARADLYHRPR